MAHHRPDPRVPEELHHRLGVPGPRPGRVLVEKVAALRQLEAVDLTREA